MYFSKCISQNVQHNRRNVIKPGSTPTNSPSPIYLSAHKNHLLSHPSHFFPHPIPILIIHLFVCYTARDKEIYLSGLIFARIDFDMIVIPYLSVSNSPLRGSRPPPPQHDNPWTHGTTHYSFCRETHQLAKQLNTSQEMNQNSIPIYLLSSARVGLNKLEKP